MSRPQTEPSSAIGHIPALDGLRGFAILLVISLHFGLGAGFSGPQGFAIGRFLERCFSVGWAGVDLFFVLSGFLISSILLASRQDPNYFGTFYSRRVLRIFPLYFGTLVLGLIILPRVHPLPSAFMGEALQHQAWLWTYTTNIALALGVVKTFGTFDLYWSLAIEEQFYLVWPLLVRLTRPRTLVTICFIAVVGSFALRWIWLGHGGHWSRVYRFTLTRVDDLAIGSLVAVVVRDSYLRTCVSRFAPVLLAATGIAFAVMFVWIDPFYPSAWSVLTVGETVLALLFAAVVFLVATNPAGRLTTVLSASWLRDWGRISYGVYVWHWPLRIAMDGPYSKLAPTTIPGHFLRAATFVAAGFAGSYAIAWFSYYLYERPFLRLKRRVPYVAKTNERYELGTTPQAELPCIDEPGQGERHLTEKPGEEVA